MFYVLACRRATLLPFFSSAHYVIPPLVSPVSFWLKRPSRRSPPPCPLPPPPAWVEGLSSCTRTARSPTAQYPYKRLWQPLEALALACLPACLPACRPSTSWLHQPPPPPPTRPQANVSVVRLLSSSSSFLVLIPPTRTKKEQSNFGRSH